MVRKKDMGFVDIFTIILMVLTFVCSQPLNVIFDTRVVGGQNVSTVIPWQVSIRIHTPVPEHRFFDVPAHWCGGTILDSKTILSAAHCFYGNRKKGGSRKQWANQHHFTVRAGVMDKEDLSGQDIEIESFIWFDYDYEERTSYHDIIILKLKSPALILNDKVQPVRLPPSRFFAEHSIDDCIISGWGAPEPGSKGTRILQWASVPTMSNDICNTQSGYNKKGHIIADGQLCAGYLSGGIDTCNGDSGGPLICKAGDFVGYVLTGVTSFGPKECGQPNFPGVYSRVPYYMDWIKENMEGESLTLDYLYDEYFDDICMTISGSKSNEPCIFPFIFKGQQFNNCITGSKRTNPWCATQVDAFGNYIRGHWGYCGVNCPLGVVAINTDSSIISFTTTISTTTTRKSTTATIRSTTTTTQRITTPQIKTNSMAKLLVTPGLRSPYQTQIIDLWDENAICDELPNHPFETGGGATGGLLKNKLPMICGGWDGEDYVNQCFIIGQPGLIPMSEQKIYSSSIVINGKLWITGGLISNTSSEFVDETKSTIGPSILFGFEKHCATIMNSTHAILTGGNKNNGKTMMVELSNFHMVRGPDMAYARYDHGCSQFKHPTNGTNFVIVAGGFESGYGKLDSVEILNADNVNAGWFEGPPLPQKCIDPSMVSNPNGNGVILLGCSDGTITDKIFKLSWKNQNELQWSTLKQKLKYPRDDTVTMLIPNDFIKCESYPPRG